MYQYVKRNFVLGLVYSALALLCMGLYALFQALFR